MGYSLGIDLGTTFTSAATAANGRVETFSLGNHAATVPSVVFLRDDGGVIIGDVAQRRGQEQPDRIAREFKRRFGDATPIMLGHTPYSAERLMAAVLQQVAAQVAERNGGPPDTVAIAHPANWGPYKIELLRQAAQLAGLGGARFVTEPEAAAVHFAAGERVEEGDLVAVYDLGGGTFDAAVLRRTGSAFETLGEPQGIERLGGIDFDEAVMSHVRATVGDALAALDPADPTARATVTRLREESAAAKEALSDDSETSVPVLLPGLQTQVRITRAELEDAIRPALRETVASLQRAIDSAGVHPDQLTAIVLAGGSSRIPLVRELVGELGRPVALDAHPKHTVALGAARLAAAGAGAGVVAGAAAGGAGAPPSPPGPPAASGPAPSAPPPSGPPPSAPPPSAHRPAAGPVPGPPAAAPPIAPPPIAPPPGGRPPADRPHRPAAASGGSRKGVLAGAAALVVAAAAIGGYLVFKPDDGKGSNADRSTTTVTTGGLTVGTDATTTTVDPHACTSSSGRCVFIDGISKDAGGFVVGYTTVGYEPLIDGAPADHHIHFYFDTTPLERAGRPVGDGTEWRVWDLDPNGNKVFHGEEGFQESEVPEGATQISAVVATIDHQLDTDPKPSCKDIP